MNQELIRMVESIAREKNIDPEVILEDIEMAMLSAIRKTYGEDVEIAVNIDRTSGEISASVDGEAMSVRDLGRIQAQTAKQVMIQRLREAERGSIFEEYSERKGQIVTSRVARWEGGSLVVELDRVEALLPRSEQIPGDSHQPDERIRAMVLEVREAPGNVKIILSRTHPDFIRALFELEVPEVAEEIIEIKALAREAGYRTKVAVNSLDPKVDAVGACVGVRGSRIKNIVDELGGEKIDIVRWNESSKMLIANALKPAEIAEIALCFELGRATVVVTDDQLSLAIGKRGQNVRLAARLTGWDIDILTPAEFNTGLDAMEKALRDVEGIDSTVIDQVIAMGMVSVMDVEEVGPEPLVNELGMEQELAQKAVIRCAEEAKRVAEAQAKAKEEKKQAENAEQAATPPQGEVAEDGQHVSTAGASPPDGQAETPDEEADAQADAEATGESGDVAAPAAIVTPSAAPAAEPAGEMKEVADTGTVPPSESPAETAEDNAAPAASPAETPAEPAAEGETEKTD
ncbi:MAG: transcription termination/antitermination protein NusA [Planctomycetes bacterium]|jgi:N utilization substance protein A|nr:transcription termination/antitermination protein NusA [Planctomycetota bacterium]